MKVLIVNTMTPFKLDPRQEIADRLAKDLIIAGYEAEILRIPFQSEPVTRIPSQLLMVRAFELCNVDRVIALTFPSYLIRHHTKSLWLLDRSPDFLEDALDDDLKNLIKNAKKEALEESRYVFVASEELRRYIFKSMAIETEILSPEFQLDEKKIIIVEKLLR